MLHHCYEASPFARQILPDAGVSFFTDELAANERSTLKTNDDD